MHSTRQTTGAGRQGLLWAGRIVLSLVFFGAAGAKLLGVPQIVDLFAQIGLGQWFRYLTAALEAAGAVLLLTRLLQRLLGRLPVGWLQLTHSRGRLAAAIAGVSFANVLVLVQLGIAGALNGTIAQGYEMFRADILISAPDANTMTDGGNVARQHLWQALADPDVDDGAALYIGNVDWSRASGDTALQTFGISPDKGHFLAPNLTPPCGLADAG